MAVPPNACVDNVYEQWRFIAAGEWDKVEELLTPDNVDEDRRSGMRAVFNGRDAVLENLRAARGVGARLWSIEPIATRGDHLALMRIIVGGADRDSGFSAEQLVVTWLAPDGRMAGGVVFDPDAIDAATAEFNERARSLAL